MLTPIVREMRRAGAARSNGAGRQSAPRRFFLGAQQTSDPEPPRQTAAGCSCAELESDSPPGVARRSTRPPVEVRARLKTLVNGFFAAVSFASGQMPAYTRIHGLFIDDAKLIRNSSACPEVSRVDAFVTALQRQVESGALTSFEEVETNEITEVFGNIAHRFSTYEKRGTMDGEQIEGSGVITTQFIHTPSGWKMSSMAWDDERPGLGIPARYR